METDTGLEGDPFLFTESSKPEDVEPVGPSSFLEAQPIDKTSSRGERRKPSSAEYKLDPDFSSDGNPFMAYLKNGGKATPTIDYASIWAGRKERVKADPLEAFDFLTSDDQAELHEHLRPRSDTIIDDEEWLRNNINVILRKFSAYTDEQGYKAIQDTLKDDLDVLIIGLRKKYKKSENIPVDMLERLHKLIDVIKAEPEVKPQTQATLPT